MKENELNDIDLSDFDELDKAILKSKIENPAITRDKLAKEMKVGVSTIYRRFNSEKMSSALSQIQINVIDVLLDGQIKAANKLIELVDNDDPNVCVKAAKEILKGVLSEKQDINLSSDGFTVNVTVENAGTGTE